MEPSPRQQTDPRSIVTRNALLDAAERLFAREGIDAVSLRQIGSATGSGNTRVVAYHFGSKDDLVEAIYRRRMPEIDSRRRALLEELDAIGQGQDPHALLRAMCLPWFEQVDVDGQHSYGRFLCAMMSEGRGPTARLIADPSPATLEIWTRLQQHVPEAARPLLPLRLFTTNNMVLNALRLIDAQDGPAAQTIFEDVVTMSVAALLASPGI
jgi:AcrR family transcriptional regulator